MQKSGRKGKRWTGKWTGQMSIYVFYSKGQKKGESNELYGCSDKGFGAEKRFKSSLRCQISIGFPYANNSKEASSLFSLWQNSPSAPGRDSHARLKPWGACFSYCSSAEMKLLQSLLFILLPLKASVLMAKFPNDCSLHSAHQHVSLRCNHWLPSARAASDKPGCLQAFRPCF